MNARVMTHCGPRHGEESGYILVVTIFVLVLLLLLFTMMFNRVNNNTDMSSAIFWRTQSIMAANAAVPDLEQAISAAADNAPLEYHAGGLPAWYQDVSPQNVVAPVFSTWENCQTQSATSGANCYAITNNGFSIKEIVQPTGLSNAYVCGSAGLNAVFYNVYIQATPVSGSGRAQSGAVVQVVYRMCVK